MNQITKISILIIISSIVCIGLSDQTEEIDAETNGTYSGIDWSIENGTLTIKPIADTTNEKRCW